MNQSQFSHKKNKIALVVMLILVLSLPISWILYRLFGHQLITAIYHGKSIGMLNEIIASQDIHPLSYYIMKGDRLFVSLSSMLVFSFIYLFSIWSGRHIPKKYFLCLILALSLCQTTLYINYKNMDSLFISFDHPKLYSMTLENANLLMKHGAPFGFNHNFQGGIPSFYLRSCFLEFIPFSIFLGERIGYQAMLIFFIVLIPLSLFFLVLELTKNEEIAKLVSFISTFQLGLWPLLYYGITPAIVAMPLLFLSLLFFLKYFYNEKYRLFPLLFFSGVLAYTNIVVFAIMLSFFIIIFIYKLITQREFFYDFKKIIYFGSLNFLVCLPFFYSLFNYVSFFEMPGAYFKEKPSIDFIFLIWFNLKCTTNLPSVLFLSSLFFLLCFYHNVLDPKERLILRNMLIFSLIILFLSSLTTIANIGVEIFSQKITWLFAPFLIVFNLSLFLLLRINKTTKIFGIIILSAIILNQYQLSDNYLTTVNTISDIDDKLYAYISPWDFALFENCARLKPTKEKKEFYDKGGYDHWLTYLQKDLGAKFFSHMGDDPHPYNNLRHMYITNGLYKGEPLGRDNEEEFIALLKDWGVNKVCVWSPTTRRFFDNSEYFKLLGESKRYICYAATYEILPQVRLNKGSGGRIVDEGPFSFTVHLQNISEKQTITINKNYFNFWSAYNEKGDKIPLRECNQKICFDATDNGYVFFKYQKNILLNLISLSVLFGVLISDILSYRRI
jgi:hypothetical protein